MTSETEPAVNVEVEVTPPPEPEPEPVAPTVIEVPSSPPSTLDGELVSQIVEIRGIVEAQNTIIDELRSSVVTADTNSAIAEHVAETAIQEIAEVADDIEALKEEDQAPAVMDVAPERKHWFFG